MPTSEERLNHTHPHTVPKKAEKEEKIKIKEQDGRIKVNDIRNYYKCKHSN